MFGRNKNKQRTTKRYIDQEMFEVSQLFFLDEDSPTLGIEEIPRKRMDYSIDSLALVNDYLESVRNQPGLEAAWNKVVLRCGGYVGEVISWRCENREYHWIDYDAATVLDHEAFERFGRNISTAAVLYSEGPSFCFPLAKVNKYLENGREDDVLLFAQAMISKTA